MRTLHTSELPIYLTAQDYLESDRYVSIVHHADMKACYSKPVRNNKTVHQRQLPVECIILYAQNKHGIQYVGIFS